MEIKNGKRKNGDKFNVRRIKRNGIKNTKRKN